MRRIRILAACVLVAGASVFALPAHAFAQEHEGGEDVELNHEQEECIHTIEEGGDPEDCHEAPSPILPATNEIVWGSISFVILFILLRLFAYPAIKQGMDARSERIRNSLDEAERTKAEAQSILDEYNRQLADARNEAARIVEEARQAADAMRRDLMTKAEAEAAATRERAQADIAAQVERATADLRNQVAQLSVEAAEMVVKNQLTDRDAQIRLVEDYIAQVGSQN